MTILSVAVLAVTAATTTGHQHLNDGDRILRAVRIAENLMDEIRSRPYDGTVGGPRSDWHIDDFNGFAEAIGSMQDFTGEATDDTEFGRSVEIQAANHTVAELDGAVLPGKNITITVLDAEGTVYVLSRFVAEVTP
jgi:hypothetical protein